MLAGDLVIRQDDLAFGLIPTDNKTFRGNAKRAAGEESRSSD
jgi:hypothetical protein